MVENLRLLGTVSTAGDRVNTLISEEFQGRARELTSPTGRQARAIFPPKAAGSAPAVWLRP